MMMSSNDGRIDTDRMAAILYESYLYIGMLFQTTFGGERSSNIMICSTHCTDLSTGAHKSIENMCPLHSLPSAMLRNRRAETHRRDHAVTLSRGGISI